MKQYYYLVNDIDLQQIGKLIILLGTYTGSARYLQVQTQNIMTYVCKYDNEDLFITFTYILNQKEITDELKLYKKPVHRHDNIARDLNNRSEKN